MRFLLRRLLRAKSLFRWVAIVCSLLVAATVVRIGFYAGETGRWQDALWRKPTPLEEWMARLGCDFDSLPVCRDKIRYMAELQGIQQARVQEWTQAALNRTADGGISEAYSRLRLVERHSALIPLDPQYAPRSEWADSPILPDVQIVGLASHETATHHLYRLLLDHGQVEPFFPQDVNKTGVCLEAAEGIVWERKPVTSVLTDEKRKVQANLFRHYERLASSRPANKKNKKMTINHCVGAQDLWLQLHYLKSPAKYILLYRDPADWLWESWNAHLDAERPTYRSPELFHETVVADRKTLEGVRLSDLRQASVTTARRLLALAGRSNILFVKHEDMVQLSSSSSDPESGVLLDQLSDFLGLDRKQFNKRALEDYDEEESAAPHLTGQRRMLDATRTLLYIRFWEECQLWQKDFGISYPDCVNVIQNQPASDRG